MGFRKFGKAVQEKYSPVNVASNASATFQASSVIGFLTITSGTITISDVHGKVIVGSLPVTAGVYVPIPFYISPYGGRITTSDGASGVLGVA